MNMAKDGDIPGMMRLPLTATTIFLIGVCVGSFIVFTLLGSKRFSKTGGASRSIIGNLKLFLISGIIFWMVGISFTLVLHLCSSHSSFGSPGYLRKSAQDLSPRTNISPRWTGGHLPHSSSISKMNMSVQKLTLQTMSSAVIINGPGSILSRFRYCFPHQSCPGFVSHAPLPRFPESIFITQKHLKSTLKSVDPNLQKQYAISHRLSTADFIHLKNEIKRASAAPSSSKSFLEADRHADPFFVWNSPGLVEACKTRAQSSTIDEQFNYILRSFREREDAASSMDSSKFSNKIPVVFSLVDESYLDMLDEMWDMVNDKGDMGKRFIYVSLDDSTTAAACVAGYPVVHFSRMSESDIFREPTVRERVYHAKYSFAVSLIVSREDFFFLEMDTWLREDVLRIFSPPHSSADLTLMIHQDNPFIINIGMYFVRANIRTEELFRTMEGYVRSSKTFPDIEQMSYSRVILMIIH